MLISWASLFDCMIYIVFFIVLLVIEVFYFKLADRYNITDNPNHRSSHNQITIRGGGIIFPIALVMWFFSFGLQYPFFMSGVAVISLVSFVDDLNDVSRRLRMAVHAVCVSLAFYQLHLFATDWWLIIIAYILVIGTINAYNFMDGINGITGIYSLVLLSSLLWINEYWIRFVDASMFVLLISSLIVFLFFNFRKKAMCFAGDVGSISMAIIACFLLTKLIVQTSQPYYALMLSVYGVDVIYTIVVRLIRKENIFEAHRSHLYQILVNQKKKSHLIIAFLYGLVQLLINIAICYIIKKEAYSYLYLLLGILLTLYIGVRPKADDFKNNKKKQTKN